MSDNLLSVELLRKYFSYDPLTGLITKIKLISAKDRIPVGSIVGGSPDNGYYRTKIFGNRIFIHQLAYALHTGAWAPALIDHKDRNPLNNRFENLRPASHRENQQNKRLSTLTKTGYRGVILKKDGRNRPYAASIREDGRRRFLGHFATAAEASAVYEAAAQALHGEFYCPIGPQNG